MGSRLNFPMGSFKPDLDDFGLLWKEGKNAEGRYGRIPPHDFDTLVALYISQHCCGTEKANVNNKTDTLKVFQTNRKNLTQNAKSLECMPQQCAYLLQQAVHEIRMPFRKDNLRTPGLALDERASCRRRVLSRMIHQHYFYSILLHGLHFSFLQQIRQTEFFLFY
ncbi:hypothetical protein CEXT_786111 [Caerostris extrusa]|uniref:Uncharacterized protein n=1 Tax=Caerostris extrusa TaxID=172846 RepID=A0AAV4VRE4_CAEEX|nr:hypothetical protein CEXT_786111 [Caerostris extrusa]